MKPVVVLFFAFLVVLSAIGVFLPTISRADSSTEPLLQMSDLVYQGAFRVPDGQFGSSQYANFDYSDDGLAYNPAHNSLFIKGHTYAQMVAEISIPTLVNSNNINNLNTATVLQNFADITEGQLNQENIPYSATPNVILGGLLVYNNKLIGSYWAYYDNGPVQQKSHFYHSLTLGQSGTFKGMYKVNYQNAFASFLGGYMTAVPSEWQSALGGPALTGHCCTSIIGHQSLGPSAWVFDPDKLGVQDPVPSTPVVHYPLSHPSLGTWDHPLPANPIYDIATTITGVVFPAGTRSILFFGHTGLGEQCYGTGGNGDCNDPANSYKGCHAYPYSYYVWAYDVNDFVAVKNGQKNPWDIRPYLTSTLTLPFTSNEAFNELNGAAYDPATQRLYIAQKCAPDVYCLPVIHVFKVNIPASASPAAPSNLRLR
jgi:hypothetical protein